MAINTASKDKKARLKLESNEHHKHQDKTKSFLTISCWIPRTYSQPCTVQLEKIDRSGHPLKRTIHYYTTSFAQRFQNNLGGERSGCPPRLFVAGQPGQHVLTETDIVK